MPTARLRPGTAGGSTCGGGTGPTHRSRTARSPGGTGPRPCPFRQAISEHRKEEVTTTQSEPTKSTPSVGDSGRDGSGISSSKTSRGATRWPVSRSSPQVEQSDIPTGTTLPQLGQRRALERASAPFGLPVRIGLVLEQGEGVGRRRGALAGSGERLRPGRPRRARGGRTSRGAAPRTAADRSRRSGRLDVGSSLEPPLLLDGSAARAAAAAGPFRVGSIEEAGLGSAIAESAGSSVGAANFVEHLGHFSWRPAAESGTFSTTPQVGTLDRASHSLMAQGGRGGLPGTRAIGEPPPGSTVNNDWILPSLLRPG